jgi:hypothetical protein
MTGSHETMGQVHITIECGRKSHPGCSADVSSQWKALFDMGSSEETSLWYCINRGPLQFGYRVLLTVGFEKARSRENQSEIYEGSYYY